MINGKTQADRIEDYILKTEGTIDLAEFMQWYVFEDIARQLQMKLYRWMCEDIPAQAEAVAEVRRRGNTKCLQLTQLQAHEKLAEMTRETILGERNSVTHRINYTRSNIEKMQKENLEDTGSMGDL